MVDLSNNNIEEMTFNIIKKITKKNITEEPDILEALGLVKKAMESKCNTIWDEMGIYELQ